MTRLFARIRAPGEAEAVAAAGFDGIASDLSEDPGGALARLWRAPAQAGPDRMVLADGGAVRELQVVDEETSDAPAAAGVSVAGVGGLLIGGRGRILDRPGFVALAEIRSKCRASRLLCGLGGELEPPDLPRLLVLEPDFLVLGRTLRLGGADDGALDPGALQLVRGLAPRDGRPLTGPSPAMERRPTTPLEATKRVDRIFLRDLVLDIEIGAYQSERGRRQRVRFSVEAELVSAAGPVGDLRDVVSYDLFTDAIRVLTTNRHVTFVETLAEEIAAIVLLQPRVRVVRITIEKLEVGPGSVGVTIERDRS